MTGRLELSSEGRALKFFEVRPFALRLTPEVIAAAAKTVTTRDGERSSPQTEEEKP